MTHRPDRPAQPHGAATGDRSPRRARAPAADDRRRRGARARTRCSAAACSARTRTCASAGEPGRSRPRRSRPRSGRPPPTPTRPAHRRRRRSTYDAGGAEPDRLRHRRDVRGQRPGLLHPERPDRLHDVAARAGPRLRLGHAQVVPGVLEPAQRLLRRRDDRARRVRPRRRPRPPRQLRRAIRTTRTPSSRPSRGPSRRPAGTCTRSGAATWRRSSSSTTCRPGPPSTRPAWTSPPILTLSASSTAVTRRRLDDADRDAQGRRLRLVPAARRQPDHGRTVTLQRRAAGDDDLGDRRDDAGRRGRRHLRDARCRRARTPTTARCSRRPSSEGINGDTSPTVRVVVFSQCESVAVRRRASTRHASDQEGRTPMRSARCEHRRAGRCWPSSLVATIVAACDSAERGGSAGGSAAAPTRPGPTAEPTAIGGARDRHPERVRRVLGRPGADGQRRTVDARQRATVGDAGGRGRRAGDRTARLVHLARRRVGQPVAARDPAHGRRRRAADRHDRRRRGRRRLVRPSRAGRDDRRQRAPSRWARPPARRWPLPRPPPGTWSVQVTVRFANDLGSATYYWRLTVR